MKRFRVWEWEATRTDEHGDIQWSEQSERLADLDHGDTADGSLNISLVFSLYEHNKSLAEPVMIERSWAEVIDGLLSEQTNEQVMVPVKYHNELIRSQIVSRQDLDH